MEAAQQITGPHRGIWSWHSDDATPAWVAARADPATFTANCADVLPVALGKVGVFNAATAGTMAFSSLLSPTVPMNTAGDAVTITETVTTS